LAPKVDGVRGPPTNRARFETYAASARRFGTIVAQSGADVHIANHTNQDNSPAKMAALEKKRPGIRTRT
jgi:hypothetical protein